MHGREPALRISGSDEEPADFLAGGGELGRLVRSHDWERTSLGAIDAWPQSLKTAVGLVLQSPVPIVMLWGEDGIMIYNDAYSGFAGGRHPQLLGSKVLEGWPEVADFNRRVMDVGLSGGTLSFRDQRLTLYRNGVAEDVWMNLDYSPIRDESGKPAGVLAIVVETTTRVQADERLKFQADLADRLRAASDPQEIKLAAAEALGGHLGVSRVGYGEIDTAQLSVTVGRDWTDGTVASLGGETRPLDSFGPNIIAVLRAGETLRLDDVSADMRSAPYAAGYASIGARSMIVVPLIKGGSFTAILYLHEPQPRRWTDAAVALAQDVAERTWASVERARAEAATRAAEAEAASVLDSITEGFVLVDREFRVLRINQEGLRLERRPASEILGKTHWEAWPGTEESEMGRLYKRAMVRRAPVSFDHYYTFPSGHSAWLELRAYPSGNGLALFYRDISARKEAEYRQRQIEAELRESEERLRVAQEAGAIGTFELFPEAGRIFVSQEFCRIWGVEERSEFQTAELLALIHPEDRERVKTGLRKLPKGALGYIEYRIIRPDTGAVRWVARQGEAVRERGGETRYLGVSFDITDRKLAEEALRESEDHYRHTVELNPQVSWTARPDGQLDHVARRWHDWTGTGGLGSSWGEAIHPDDLHPSVDAWTRAVTTGQPYDIEHRVRLRDGTYHWMHSRAFPRRDPSGVIVKWYGTTEDIEGRKRAEEELRRLNESLEGEVAQRTAERDRMWELSQDLLVLVGADGVYRAVNPAWRTVLGYEPDEIVGRHFAEFIHPDDVAPTADAVGRATRDVLNLFENRYRHKDGSYRWISWTAAPGEGVVYGAGRDITAEKGRQSELEAAQEALRQAQKMEAVGQLTGGIAHDFNNLLTGIIGSLELLERRVAVGRTENLERYTTIATASAKRAAGLTQRLLAFSRRQALDPKPISLNQLIASMEDLVRRTMGERVKVETVLAGGLWPTRCDVNQMENALLNLCINARDAMPEGGKLTIETANAHLDDAYAARQREVNPGQYVVMCVTDTGGGMTPEVIGKAFEPFFTTKPIGQGTGLGLSQIYGFIKQSGGHVGIYSEVGEGTTVKVYLPRYFGTVEPDAVPSAATPVRAEENETVLVVEDEDTVRLLVLDVLEDLGYSAHEAIDSNTALRILESRARIDLLVTDVGLPGLNGRQLADRARELRPDLKVLFITGYAHNAAVGNGLLEPGMEVVSKPFAVDALARKIRAMITGD